MAALPPPPPPRGPGFQPPEKPSTLRTVLKVVGLTVGAFAMLVLVGAGLLLSTCGGFR